jgi:glycosyltransferase involved in cell wall biosynthesis
LIDSSVVIPVYNSAPILPELIARLGEVLPTISKHYEVVLVNDGSRDQSWQVISSLAEQYPWVRGIDMMRNYGQHNALLAGVRAAKYEITVTMDDDLQHPPDQIPLLIDYLNKGYDVVYGTPQQQQQSLWRNASSSLAKFVMQRAMGQKIAPSGSAFRAFRTQVRQAFADYSSPFVSIDVLLTWGTSRFGAVPVRHEARRTGRSGYNLMKLAILAMDMTTGFSTWPLRLASLVGFGVTLLGFGLLVFVIAEYLITGATLSVFRFFTAIVAIFSGAQMFALGIIGEYLARMHLRLLARPAYLIRGRTEVIDKREVAGHV